MIRITITENEENQRLDRFLKKYFKNAALSHIYKMIRKDVKVNGKRTAIDTVLKLGDELALYITEEAAAAYLEKKTVAQAKRQFRIAYEDENVMIVEKPFGLLVHGDKTEKKNTLANQVAVIWEKVNMPPQEDLSSVPVNRLDRNTTTVIFARTTELCS